MTDASGTGNSPRRGRTLVVSESPGAAAALLPDFDDARIVTPAELDTATGEGPIDLAVVTGVPVADGRLAQVLEALVRRAPAVAQVGLDVTDPVGSSLTSLTDGGAGALRGLAIRSTIQLSQALVVVLGQADAADAVPDLSTVDADAAQAARQRNDLDAEHAVLRSRVEALNDELASLHEERAQERESVTSLREQLAAANKQREAAERELTSLRTTVFGRLARVERRLGRSSKSRRRAVVAAVALIGLLVVSGIAVGMAFATSTGYVGGVVTALGLITVAALAFLVLRVRRALIALAANTKATQAGFRQANARLEKQGAALDELRRASSVAVTRKLDALTATANELVAGRKTDQAALKTMMQTETRIGMQQTQALVNLFGIVPVNDVVPTMGGWAASPDVVALLVAELLRLRPALVVECGSGVSTVWLSLAAERYGIDTRIVALEHDESWAALTREALARHGVAHRADVRHAPPVDIGLDGHDTPWYDLAASADLSDIGLLFVDGPPEVTGPAARYPAIPVFRDRFAARGVIVLDDLVRKSEQLAAIAWTDMLPDFTLTRLPLQKSAAVFRRGD